jgi:hypothetical protein
MMEAWVTVSAVAAEIPRLSWMPDPTVAAPQCERTSAAGPERDDSVVELKCDIAGDAGKKPIVNTANIATRIRANCKLCVVELFIDLPAFLLVFTVDNSAEGRGGIASGKLRAPHG